MPKFILNNTIAGKRRQMGIIFACAHAITHGPDVFTVDDGAMQLYVHTYRPSGVRSVSVAAGKQGVLELFEQNPNRDSDYAKLVRAGAVLIWAGLNGQYTRQGLFAEPDAKLGWYENVHEICLHFIGKFKSKQLKTHTTDDPWLCDICGKNITTWELKDMYPRCMGCRVAIAQEAKGKGYDRVLEVLDEATKC